MIDPFYWSRYATSFTEPVKPAKYRWFDTGIFSIRQQDIQALILRRLRIPPNLHEVYQHTSHNRLFKTSQPWLWVFKRHQHTTVNSLKYKLRVVIRPEFFHTAKSGIHCRVPNVLPLFVHMTGWKSVIPCENVYLLCHRDSPARMTCSKWESIGTRCIRSTSTSDAYRVWQPSGR